MPHAIPKSSKVPLWQGWEQYLFASIITYNFTLCFTKVAILLLYRRVFSIGRTRTGSTILLVFVILYGIETFFSGTFTCVPVRAFWDLEIQVCYRSNAIKGESNEGAHSILRSLLPDVSINTSKPLYLENMILLTESDNLMTDCTLPTPRWISLVM